MKLIRILIIGLIFIGCNQKNNQAIAMGKGQIRKLQKEKIVTDEEEIQNLIRKVLFWADFINDFGVEPIIRLTDSQGRFYIGFDLNGHKKFLDMLREIDLFAKEFIENYNQIILTLDKKLRNNEYEKWLVGKLPPFNFANDYNPWCNCQDAPYDSPNPWDCVEVKVIEINNDRAQLIWTWGGLNSNMDSSWKEFSYNFRTVKENGKWKIAYMEGFDFEQGVKGLE